MRRRSFFAWVGVVGVGVLFFQNCAPGFAPMSSNFASLGSEGTGAAGNGEVGPLGKILIQDPYFDSKNFGLAYDADFTPYLSEATVSELDATQTSLTNGFVTFVAGDDSPTILTSPTSPLVFNGNDPRFQQLNAYYHINRLTRSMKQQQLLGPTFLPVVANARCMTGAASQNNAFFDIATRKLCLGYSPQTVDAGSVNVWSANDSDVTVHEFGHSLNHFYSTDDILGSTFDMGALDEGFADVWAYLTNNNPYIARWYGRAIYASSGILYDSASYKGLRNLEAIPKYPDSITGEIHTDSPPLSSVFFDLVQSGVPVANLKKLLSRALTDLQSLDTLSSAARHLVVEAPAAGVSLDLLQSALLKRGLYRKDVIDGLQLPPANLRIIDNHEFPSLLKNGDCSGTLDVGESALVVADVVNGDTELGTVVGKLTTTASPDDIKIETGGDVGSFVRIQAGTSFSASVKTLPNYKTQMVYAGFLVTAQKAGVYSFTLKLKGSDSIDDEPSTQTLNFDIEVGTRPNVAQTCAGDGETRVWP